MEFKEIVTSSTSNEYYTKEYVSKYLLRNELSYIRVNSYIRIKEHKSRTDLLLELKKYNINQVRGFGYLSICNILLRKKQYQKEYEYELLLHKLIKLFENSLNRDCIKLIFLHI